MAVKSTKIHSSYRRHLNKVNTKFAKAISVQTADAFLNEAKDLIFETLAMNYEVNSHYADHLLDFKVPDIAIDTTFYKEDAVQIKFPEDLYKLTRIYTKCSTNTCSEERLINIHQPTSDRLTEAIRSPFSEPSFEWKETVGKKIKDGFVVYTKGELKCKQIFIDYLKRPRDIAAPSLANRNDCYGLTTGYTDSEGMKVVNDVDYEGDDTFIWRRIAILGSILTQVAQGEQIDWQAQLKSILSVDSFVL